MYDSAGGVASIKLSVTFFYGDNVVLGPFVAELPKLETLQPLDIHLDLQGALEREAVGAPLAPGAWASLAEELKKMVPLQFQKKP